MNYHLSQVGDLPDKTKCDVIMRLITCEMKTGKQSGKTYWNGKVGDVQNPAFTLYASFFGNSPAALIGQNIIVTGMEKGSYNGKAQLSASKFSKYNEYVGDFEATTPSPSQSHTVAPNQPQVAGQSSQTAPREPSSLPVGALKVNLPLGQTVGMAIKLAGDLHLALDGQFLGSQDWQARLRNTAHQIIAISRSLENDTPLEEAPPF